MAESVLRQCRVCLLERPCRPGRRQCKDCATNARKARYDASTKHVTGRRRNYRQRAEIKGVLSGATSWVSCTQCSQMRLFKPRPDGKGGKGWRGFQCADCSRKYMAAYRAKEKAEGVTSGPCSGCGVVGEYRQGRRCADCVKGAAAAYQRSRRAVGKGKPVYQQAHSKICQRCNQRCRESGYWQGDTCPLCVKKTAKSDGKKRRAELREKMIQAGEWECHQCHQVQPVEDGGRGWNSQKCPACSRKYQRQRYHEKLKHNPEYRRKKLKRSRAYDRKRAAARKAEIRGAGGVSVGCQDTGARGMPENAPQGTTGA